MRPDVFSLLFSNCLGEQLPLEAVGVGAKWRSRTSADWFVTLRGMSGDQVSLEYSATVNLAEQPVRVGGAFYGIGADVPPKFASGFGQISVDLSRIAATSQDITLDQHFDFFASREPSHRLIIDLAFHDRCESMNAPGGS